MILFGIKASSYSPAVTRNKREPAFSITAYDRNIHVNGFPKEWKVNSRAPSDIGNRLAMKQETGDGYEKKDKRLRVLQISASSCKGKGARIEPHDVLIAACDS